MAVSSLASQGASPLGGASQGKQEAMHPVTVRAVAVGAVSVAAVAWFSPYLAFIAKIPNYGSGSLMNSALGMYFLVALVNTGVFRWRPTWALARTELFVVYGMLTVSLGLMMQGGLPYMTAFSTYPVYMATPTNGWEQTVLPHIPTWFLAETPDASRWYWEGLPSGVGVPWREWQQPWLAWGGFYLAMLSAMYCLGALLSKNWIERQRLSFPLVEVPVAITGTDRDPSFGASLLSNRVFWVGFAVPAAVVTFQWLNRFYPDVPALDMWGVALGRRFSSMPLPWSALSGMAFSFNFAIFGVMCLLASEVSLSLWLFYALFNIQLLGWAAAGVTAGSSTSISPNIFIGYMEAGGFLVLCAILIYEIRSYLRTAWLSLTRRLREDADPLLPMEGRWALLGFLAANAFMLWFGVRAGMSLGAYALLFGIFYVIILGAGRVVSASGLIYFGSAFLPRETAVRLVGAQALGPRNLTAYAYFSFILMTDMMNVAMPQMMGAFKLNHSARIEARRFAWAAGLAVLVVLVVGVASILSLVYHRGANGLDEWPFTAWPQWAFTELDASLHNPESASNWARVALGLGAAIMFGLVWLSANIAWWPVSPIGFIVASTWAANYTFWANALFAWLITTQIKRYGGLRLYRAMRPAFIGLVLGDYLTNAAMAGIWALVRTHR